MIDISILPPGLPEPVDDGAAVHLPGMAVPAIALAASSGDEVNLSTLSGRTVIYAYPMSGDDDSAMPDNWDLIPGARGCTPQHCNLRDHHEELRGLGMTVYGLATQSTHYLQREVDRIHLPYRLLSDEDLRLTKALSLPTLEVKVAGTVVLKRTTMILKDGLVEHVFYPVFPPDKSADQVIGWLRQ